MLEQGLGSSGVFKAAALLLFSVTIIAITLLARRSGRAQRLHKWLSAERNLQLALLWLVIVLVIGAFGGLTIIYEFTH